MVHNWWKSWIRHPVCPREAYACWSCLFAGKFGRKGMRGFFRAKNPQMRECYKRLRMRHACGSRREQSTLNDYSNIFEFFCTCTIFHVQFFFFLFWPASFVVAVAAAIFFSLCIVPVRASLLFNITGSSPASSFKKKSFKIISQSKMDKSPFTSAVLQSLNYGALITSTC